MTVITIVGNLTADPELRFTASGQAIAKLRVAVNSRKRSKDGTYEDGEPTYYKVTAWGGLAENCGDSLAKGTRVIAVGRIEARTWETPEGEKRSEYEVTADSVGPDLRWATARVTRASKGTPSPAAGRSEDPWATANMSQNDAEVPF